MHLKGVRFGLPLMKRLGLLKHHETYRVSWNRHPGVETSVIPQLKWMTACGFQS